MKIISISFLLLQAHLLFAQTQTLDFLFPYAPAVLSPSEYRQNIINLTPLVFYPLNEGSGTVTDNAMGNSAYDGVNAKMWFKSTFFDDNTYHFNSSSVNF